MTRTLEHELTQYLKEFNDFKQLCNELNIIAQETKDIWLEVEDAKAVFEKARIDYQKSATYMTKI